MSDTGKVQWQHLLRQFSGLGGGGELPWSECVEQPRHFQAHTFNVLAGRAKQRKMRPGIEAQMTKARWFPRWP